MPPCVRYHAGRGWLVCGLWPLSATVTAWPRPPGTSPPSVHVLALGEAGLPRPEWDGQSKRTFGSLADCGAVVALGDPTLGFPSHLCEGLADAVAIWSRRPGLVLAAMTKVDALAGRAGVIDHLAPRRAIVWPDTDPEGLAAGHKLLDHLKERRVSRALQLDRTHNDPAEWSAAYGQPCLDPADFDRLAGAFAEDGQPRAEADRLAVMQLDNLKRDIFV